MGLIAANPRIENDKWETWSELSIKHILETLSGILLEVAIIEDGNFYERTTT